MTRRVWMAAVTGLAGLVLAGCGSAQTAATAEQLPSVPGLNLSEDGLEIRNLQVPYAPEGYSTGGDVPVLMTIFNDSDQPVRLLDVDSSLGASANVVDVSAVRFFDRVVFPCVYWCESRLCAAPFGQSLIAVAQAK